MSNMGARMKETGANAGEMAEKAKASVIAGASKLTHPFSAEHKAEDDQVKGERMAEAEMRKGEQVNAIKGETAMNRAGQETRGAVDAATDTITPGQ